MNRRESDRPRLTAVATSAGKDPSGRDAAHGPAGAESAAGKPRAPQGAQSFEALYSSHYRRVYGLCRRLLRHPEQAEDATQEIFVRAYRAFDRYDATQPFAAWISRIASNHCVDLVRRASKERSLFGAEADEALDVASADPSALAGLITSERAAELKAAIDTLPDRYRLPLVLAYYEEASYDDIAATLGITRNHVGTLILRGKEALRRSLAAERRNESGEPS